jgi:hypothetical protein
MPRLLRVLLVLSCFVPAAVSALSPVEVSLQTGNPGNFVVPGKEQGLSLVLHNASAAVVSGEIELTVREFDGAQQTFKQIIKLPARAEQRLKVPLGSSRLGIRTLDYTVTAGGTSTGKRSFVYGQPAGAGPDPAGFLYGVCAHIEQDSARDAERQLAAVSQIGVSVLRMGEEWSGVEPSPSTWKWARLDERVALAERYRMRVQMLLAYGNEHAASSEARAAAQRAKSDGEHEPWQKAVRAAPRDAAWRSYIRNAAQHYKGRVSLWEIWNEPDLSNFFLGSTDDYIRMLRSAYEEVKRVDPSATVMTAGFATLNEHPWRKLNPRLQERVLVEANDAFDVHAVHEHGEFVPFAKIVDGELARIRKGMKKPKPLYFNETAASSRLGREREQAVTLVKKVSFARARGAVGYNWYDLRNDGTDSREYEHNFGLLTHDLSPKPAYAAYNELIHQLRGTTFTGSLQLGAGHHGYVFDGRGRKVVVLWTEDAAQKLSAAIVAAGAGSARVFDLMGNAAPLALSRDEVVVPLRNDPVYVEFLAPRPGPSSASDGSLGLGERSASR